MYEKLSNNKDAKSQRKGKICLIGILGRLNDGATKPDIEKAYGWSRQRLDFWIHKLEKAGLINKAMRSSTNFYDLSKQGKKIAIGHLKGVEEIQLHNIEYSYPVLKEGQFAADKEWQWGRALFRAKRITGCTVKIVGRTLVISVSGISGTDSFKLADEAKNNADAAADWLRVQGFELGQGRQTRKPEFALVGPLMKEIAAQAQIETEDFRINASQGGEAEFFTPEDAAGFMRMPEAVRGLTEVISRMEGQLGGMMQQQLAISNAIMLQATILQNQTKILAAIAEKMK